MLIQSKSFKLVGGMIEATIYGIEEQLSELIFEEFYLEALRLQKIFNFFDPKSELNVLNNKREIIASEELLEVIKFSIPFCKLTKRKYDITKGKQIMAQKKGLPHILSNASYKDLLISEKKIKLKGRDSMIDLGSVAKGYIGDKLAKFLKKQGVKSGFIDMRGDMITFGKHTETIAIQYPRIPEKLIDRFTLKEGAVATSGDYKQYIKDFDNSHIVGKQDLISVTVVCDNLMEADILATVFFVFGKEESIKYLNKHRGIKAFLIDKGLNQYDLNGLMKK